MRLVIVGAGGLAREVEWLLRDMGAAAPHQCVGFVVSDLALVGARDSRDRLLGDFRWLGANLDLYDGFAMAIGTPTARATLAAHLRGAFPGKLWPSLVHPSVRCDAARCTFGEGAIVCAGVIATTNVTIGAYALVNLACTIGHEAAIGPASVVNPGANVSGGVTVGTGVLIGTGAQILQHITVGDYATVGAGAVVTKDVAPGQTVVGIPARPLA